MGGRGLHPPSSTPTETDTLMVPGDGWRPAESGGRDIIFTSHEGTPKAPFQAPPLKPGKEKR